MGQDREDRAGARMTRREDIRIENEQREIDRDRRGERSLIPKALIALAVVAVLVVIRQLFFA